MKRFAAWVLFLLSTSFPAWSAPAAQTISPGLVLQPGVYQTKWVIPGEGRPLRTLCGNARLQDSRPASIDGVPKFTSGHPKYGWLELDANYETVAEILFALDESKGTGEGYDVLYVDGNRNGNLEDDRRVVGSTTKGRIAFYNVGSLSHSAAYPGSTNPNRLVMDVFFSIGKKGLDEGMVYYRGTWTGYMRSNKGNIPFMLLDGNGNGCYNNPVSILSEFDAEGGDQILFDWNRSGRFPDPDEYYEAGSLDLHSVMNIGGRLYMLKPSPLGDKLDVQPYRGTTGRIGLHMSPINGVSIKAVEPELHIYAGSQVYQLPADGTPITVPTGSYNVSQIAIDVKSVSGRRWRFLYYNGESVTVSRNATARWPIGGPLKLVIEMDTKELVFDPAQGRLIELYLPLGRGYLTSNLGDAEDRPTVTVTNVSGKAVYTTQAGGGGGLDTAFVVELPKSLKPGKYTVNISWKNGPFGSIKAQRQIVLK